MIPIVPDERTAIPTGTWARFQRRIVSIVLALRDHDAVHQASAMAFWLFLGLVPLAAILGWALAKFAGAEIRESIIASLVAVTPQPALEIVDEQLHRLVAGGGTVAPLSLLGFLWIASGGVHTAMVAIQNAQAGRSRPWWHNRSLSVVFTFAFLLLVTGSTMVLVFTTPAFQQLFRIGYVEEGWVQVVRYGALPTSILVATLVAAVFYRVSTMRIELGIRKRVWPGAVSFSLSWVLVSWMFSAYAKSIGRFPIFYGSLAAVALLMMWLWVSSFLLLVGSEVNLQLEGTRKTIVPPSFRWPEKLRISRKPPPPAPQPSKPASEPPSSTA